MRRRSPLPVAPSSPVETVLEVEVDHAHDPVAEDSLVDLLLALLDERRRSGGC